MDGELYQENRDVTKLGAMIRHHGFCTDGSCTTGWFSMDPFKASVKVLFAYKSYGCFIRGNNLQVRDKMAKILIFFILGLKTTQTCDNLTLIQCDIL